MRETQQIHSLGEWNKRYGNRERVTINIFDAGFKGLSIVQSECICGGRGFRLPRHVEYVHNKPEWNGITYFTDKYISPKAIRKVNSKFKVAMLTEPRELQPQMYQNIEECLGLVHLVLTHDRELLEKYPKKCRFFICSCPILGYSDIKIHPKKKLVSMIFSGKKVISGHQFRHEVYQSLTQDGRFDFIDYFGLGVGKYIYEKSETLNDYMYSIVIENNKKDFYFTEKIFDCFASGNVPIFWGSPSIGKFFDSAGIKEFSTIEELKEILLKISESEYQGMAEVIQSNFDRVQHFMDPDDLAYETVSEFLKDTYGYVS